MASMHLDGGHRKRQTDTELGENGVKELQK